MLTALPVSPFEFWLHLPVNTQRLPSVVGTPELVTRDTFTHSEAVQLPGRVMKRGSPMRRTGFTPAQRATRLTQTVMAKKRAKVTPEERAARKLIAHRSENVCEVCRRTPAVNVHHRRNRSQGGTWDLANLLHLCGSGTTGCHGHITVNPKVSLEQGWTVRSTRNPADVPVWLGHRGFCFLNTDGSITEVEEEEAAS